MNRISEKGGENWDKSSQKKWDKGAEITDLRDKGCF
jgi:hypothetical protein